MICPLLVSCSEEVNLEHYTKYCVNIERDAYKECPVFKEISQKKMKPIEWSRITATR